MGKDGPSREGPLGCNAGVELGKGAVGLRARVWRQRCWGEGLRSARDEGARGAGDAQEHGSRGAWWGAEGEEDQGPAGVQGHEAGLGYGRGGAGG